MKIEIKDNGIGFITETEEDKKLLTDFDNRISGRVNGDIKLECCYLFILLKDEKMKEV